ncbi:MAG: FMN-binding protein [Candidatus Saccharibacteria bacterium]|nr:FMN-binding protein [Candidatus Saccharibacteria bacterium]
MDMKKAVVIVIAVAILGLLGLQVNKKPASQAGQTGAPTNTSSTGTTTAASPGNYKDGTFTGNTAQTPYGPVQVSAVVSAGKITTVNLLQMPFAEGESKQISASAGPQLKQNAIAAQSAHIDFVSGATSTTYGFEESLQAALDKAAS